MLIRVPPSEWVVRLGWGGRLLGATQGSAFWLWPWVTYVRFPSTLQWMLFSASQITRENQGVDVKGAFSWRVVDPLRAYQNLNMQKMAAGEVRELLGCRSTSSECVVDHGPLMRTTLLIRQLAESVTRNAIANMTLEEALRNRRAIVETLTRQIDSVIEPWGVAITSIEIVDVYISSKEIFSHMQADYRERLRREARTVQIAAEEEISQRQLASRSRLSRIEHDQGMGALTLQGERGQREVEVNAELEQQRQARSDVLALERTIAASQRQKAEAEASLERQRMEHAATLLHKRELLELTRQRLEIHGQANDASRAHQLISSLPRLMAGMKADKTTIYANSLPGATIEGLAASLTSLAEMAGLKLPR